MAAPRRSSAGGKGKGKGRGKGGAVVVTGVREIDRKLRKLEAKAQRKVIRQAMDRALKPVLEQVKADVPVLTGATRQNIKIRAGKSRRGVVRREIRVGDKQMGEGFGAAFVEFGTKDAPARPFMAPAFEARGPAARDQAEREILAGVLGALAAAGGGKSTGVTKGPKSKGGAVRRRRVRASVAAKSGGGRRRDSKGRFIEGGG